MVTTIAGGGRGKTLEGESEMQVQTGTLTRERKKRTTEREKKTGERRREPEKREGETLKWNATDLGIMEWIIPVGRAERAGDREGEGDMQTGILTRERKKRAIEGEKKNRRAEERTKEEGGKEEGRGNARGSEEKASRKGERGRRRR